MIGVSSSFAFVVFVWWFSTGAILLLGRLPKTTYIWSFSVATLLTLLAVVGLALSSRELTPENVFVSFCCVIVIWGWHEMAFLFGYVTGPRSISCPPDARGWARFRYAFDTLKHHELALLVTFILAAAVTWNGENLYGLAAYLVLWLMRISAKLNLFFGVPHFSDQLLPAHLVHLSTYFRVAPVTRFFVGTFVVSSAAAAALLAALVFGTATNDAHTIGLSVLLTLLLLAILEHGFMVLPVRDTALWQWAMIETRGRPKTRTTVRNYLGGAVKHNDHMSKTPLVVAGADRPVGGMKNGL